MSDRTLTHARMKLEARIIELRDGTVMRQGISDPHGYERLEVETIKKTLNVVLAEIAALLADTRAATEGSEKVCLHGHKVRTVGCGSCVMLHDELTEHGYQHRKPAASAPTRETGWIDEAVRVIQVLETDVFGQPIDRNVLRACITDAMALLPTPPRDERPQTAEYELSCGCFMRRTADGGLDQLTCSQHLGGEGRIIR